MLSGHNRLTDSETTEISNLGNISAAHPYMYEMLEVQTHVASA